MGGWGGKAGPRRGIGDLTLFERWAGGVLRGYGRSHADPLIQGCITVAALVAAADPAISLPRRATIDQIFDELKSRKDFEVDKAVGAFQRALDRLRIEGAGARRAAHSSLAKLAQGSEEGTAKAGAAEVDLLLRIARTVALADGTVTPAARSALADIAAALGASLPPLETVPEAAPRRIVVIGNEKGGTGKSTTAIHVAIGLAARGAKVACIDLDSRQATLSRFLANRKAAAGKRGGTLTVPRYRRLAPTGTAADEADEAVVRTHFAGMLSELADHDVVVIDTPGFASRIAQLAHAAADVLITPINDSFIDIDALADIDVLQRQVRAPSPYSSFVRQLRDRRRAAAEAEVDWIVVRNRIGQLDSRNTRDMAGLLGVLAERLGFRLKPGFSERVVYRELFFSGLTLFDLAEESLPHASRASFRRARREVEELVDAVSPPDSGGSGPQAA